jgi:hypothetical protein
MVRGGQPGNRPVRSGLLPASTGSAESGVLGALAALRADEKSEFDGSVKMPPTESGSGGKPGISPDELSAAAVACEIGSAHFRQLGSRANDDDIDHGRRR